MMEAMKFWFPYTSRKMLLLRVSEKVSAAKTVQIQDALKKEEESQKFSFLRSWTAPLTILHLALGRLAFGNITLLVGDDDFTCVELLIRLLVLQHLQVDTRRLLENSRADLDGADCSLVVNSTRLNRSGIISRMMVARMYRIPDSDEPTGTARNAPDRPRVNFYQCHAEEDSFPDPLLRDPLLLDSDQHE